MGKHLPNRASVLLATAAAFFALGGIAVAGSHYIITSKH